MDYFKGDADEIKFVNTGANLFNQIEQEKDDFFDGAYACFVLGEILHDSGRVPLANAIPRSIFRESFTNIFDAFLEAGTFEGYLTVFRDIFGETVDVTFTVPAPGRLQIDIVADGIVEENLIGREIVADEFVNSEILDQTSDNIVGSLIKGFNSQYELEVMLNEMVPAGIFTEISLTLGA